MESRLLPFRVLSLLPARRALVFAPHPDDEVFGCGGAIGRLCAANVPVRVIVATDGGANPPPGVERAAYVAQRREESRHAAACLGGYALVFWDYPDRGLRYGERLVEECLTAIRDWQADLVLAPSHFEIHPDHRALAMATFEAARRHGACDIAFYEVGQPLPQPNALLDIGTVLDAKRTAMRCFSSQLARQDYAVQIEALNRYRTYQAPGLAAAEAFMVLDASELGKADPLGLFRSEHARQAALGLMADEAMAPLVSVIVRSIDRPTLDDALDSIALQTYPNIEVVLVNAKGPGHRALPQWCGRFRLRMAGGDAPLRRAAAANCGLAAARGDYLIFLDDDDWFDAGHIAGLVAATRSGTVPVVYSGIRCVGMPHQSVLNRPFDRVRLLAGNFIPIHALLFSRTFVEQGCRFDETLDLYEDWDFLIQLACHTSFRWVDAITATYRLLSDSNSGVQGDGVAIMETRRRIYTKWRARLAATLAPDEWFTMLDRVQLLDSITDQRNNLEGKLTLLTAERDRLAAERDRLAAEHDRLAAEHDAQIAALLNSTSWKITQPLRFAMHQTRRIGRAVQQVMTAIRRSGGLRNTIRKAVRLYRREGLDGIKRGFRVVAQIGHINPSRGSAGFDRNDYTEWVRRYDTLTDDMRSAMRARIDAFAHRPLISVIMPTYNPNIEWLGAAIESVRNQIYPHWELCIADDASTDSAVRPFLERYAAMDTRLKVMFRADNGHISVASNSALELATGEWVATLDQDDLLAEHALFWIVETINQHPDAQLIYSDEDKIDEYGRRSAPYFKCDWNEDLFYSHNMFCHLGTYRTALLRQIGGFQPGSEGAQDYDLVLRCLECIDPAQIRHVPRVLYHWRMHTSSTALDANAKPYAMLAGEKALNDHFQRRGINAKAELIGFSYRIRYALPENPPLVSLIIPTRNGLRLLRQCVESILAKTTYPNFEILIIDNGSDEPATLDYLDSLSSRPRLRVLRDGRSFNFSALNNAAVQAARGELVALINNDIEVISPEWLTEMASHALRPGIGAVGARLWYPNDTLQHGGIILGIGGVAGHAHKHLPRHHPGYQGRARLIQAFSAITAACLVIRKAVFEEVGGLDEENLPVAFNDVDFCLRVREAGYRNLWTPYAELYHHESATRGYEDTPEKIARFSKEEDYMKQRWGELLLNDPAYSPNLTLDFEDFSLAWPPRVKMIRSE